MKCSLEDAIQNSDFIFPSEVTFCDAGSSNYNAVKLGSVIAPLLFTLYIDASHLLFGTETTGLGCQVGNSDNSAIQSVILIQTLVIRTSLVMHLTCINAETVLSVTLVGAYDNRSFIN